MCGPWSMRKVHLDKRARCCEIHACGGNAKGGTCLLSMSFVCMYGCMYLKCTKRDGPVLLLVFQELATSNGSRSSLRCNCQLRSTPLAGVSLFFSDSHQHVPVRACVGPVCCERESCLVRIARVGAPFFFLAGAAGAIPAICQGRLPLSSTDRSCAARRSARSATRY